MTDKYVPSMADINEEEPPWFVYEVTEYEQDLPGDESHMETITPIEADVKQELIELQYEENEGELEGDIVVATAETNDLSQHNLILKQIINEQGLKEENYFCQECTVEYDDINEFLYQHPGVELLNENPDEETILPYANNTHDKLWDLVEDIKEAVDEDISETSFMDMEIMQPKTIEQESAKEPLTKSETTEGEQDRYFCFECQQVFTDFKTAELHDCTHQQESKQQQRKLEDEQPEYTIDESQKFVDFACAYCTKTFSSYDDLLSHIANCQKKVTIKSATTPEGLVYHCEMCNKNYNSLRSYSNHQRLHKRAEGGKIASLSGPTTCEICNTRFASSKNLRLHMKMHDERVVKSIQEALPAGAQAEYNELNQFYCEICNKSFDQRLLTIHKNMHQNVEEYNCGSCNKQFNNLFSYEMHMQMHAETKLYSKKKSVVKDDHANNADKPPKKHQCQYCGKEFQRPYEKVKHERIHTGEKPYNCEVCGKSFRVSYSLTLHLRTHTDIRPYVCATCNKRFKQQSVYVHHLKTHMAERTYKCDICGKSFRTAVQLCGHKNSHMKPFNCTECFRPFASLYAVKIHMKTHNNAHKSNKNFKNRCKICGISYARILELRYHLKEKHGLDVDPGQLLSAEYGGEMSSAQHHKDLDFDAETAELMNAADEAQINDRLREFADDTDEEADEEKNVIEENVILSNEHNVNNNNLNLSDDDFDETTAATQNILQANQEVIEENFQAEEIITDW